MQCALVCSFQFCIQAEAADCCAGDTQTYHKQQQAAHYTCWRLRAAMTAQQLRQLQRTAPGALLVLAPSCLPQRKAAMKRLTCLVRDARLARYVHDRARCDWIMSLTRHSSYRITQSGPRAVMACNPMQSFVRLHPLDVATRQCPCIIPVPLNASTLRGRQAKTVHRHHALVLLIATHRAT